ncbi:acetylornithine deacetylase [Heterostelium album PN500]|uniref:Acetylornithine deacetylase n=1 Tax=Heterostelium pallidum (strain ATCC 26659 / Pp 5 / PN500) TaxID=670386 RepID=D3AXB9_HETP5|nr:acetylornithine deacetylase [Heterostelium album PN500]EFA86188.1 acetylornithine deacetylase [Heterostelium album PN500]|eukprot:XP_020438293.1 acetylornithine deacetylase [Heterostelium album PN500]
MTVAEYELNEARFLELLTKLIAEGKTLQNQPPELIPVEDNAGRHVLAALEPYTVEKGGVLKVEHIAFHKGRGNILIQYPGTVENKCISFVGSHLDVVPAIAANWERDPFTLVIEGDRLYGRGTTDCLGHVALLTDLFITLATKKPALKHSINAVFIASEENDEIPGVGVDELDKQGKIDHLKYGPLYWVDSADMQPTIGTGGAQNWNLKACGKIFHSAIPNKAINTIELANEALAEVQKRFYADFPAHPEEHRYGYEVSSTMKPTLWKKIDGSYNQIPGEAVICGDIRLTPFYDMAEMRKKVESYVADINSNITDLRNRGPFSKYSLPEEGLTGKIEIEWIGESSPGVACNIDSKGYQALGQATKEVTGELKPVSTCGTLPLVKDLQASGFDLQITGFGKEETYHADNEYASLSDFKKAIKILTRTIDLLEQQQ